MGRRVRLGVPPQFRLHGRVAFRRKGFSGLRWVGYPGDGCPQRTLSLVTPTTCSASMEWDVKSLLNDKASNESDITFASPVKFTAEKQAIRLCRVFPGDIPVVRTCAKLPVSLAGIGVHNFRRSVSGRISAWKGTARRASPRFICGRIMPMDRWLSSGADVHVRRAGMRHSLHDGDSPTGERLLHRDGDMSLKR